MNGFQGQIGIIRSKYLDDTVGQYFNIDTYTGLEIYFLNFIKASNIWEWTTFSKHCQTTNVLESLFVANDTESETFVIC